jgi:hypothetical protein
MTRSELGQVMYSISEADEFSRTRQALTRSMNARHQNLGGRLGLALFGLLQFSLTLLDNFEGQIRSLSLRGIRVKGSDESLERK